MAVITSVVLAVPLAGAASAAASARAPRRISVVAAFYPLAEVAQQVGGRYVTVHNLTPAGAEPHDLELASDQVDLVLGARVVIVMGQGIPTVRRSGGEAAQRRDGECVVATHRSEVEGEAGHG